MRKIVRNTIFIFCTAFILFACDNNVETADIENVENNAKSLVHLSVNDSIFVGLSKALAKAISDEQVFETLKEKIDEKFDRDFNTLFINIMNAPVKADNNLRSASEKTFLNCLAENSNKCEAPELRSSNVNNFTEQINLLMKENPLLQIAMPLMEDYASISTEDLRNSIVTFVPENYKEGITEWIVGYDASGKEYILSTKNPPEIPVIVISRNERIVSVPKGIPFDFYEGEAKLVFSSDIYNYYLPEPLMAENPTLRTYSYLMDLDSSDGDGGGGGGGGGTGGGTGGGGGTPISLFKLATLRVTEQHDDWVNGGSEFEFRCSQPLAPSYTTTGLTVQRI